MNNRHGADGPLLVVDDDESVARVLKRLVTLHGYECEIAHSPFEALNRLEELNVPLVLTDMNMPGGNGLDLIDEIRSRYPDVATVLVTGKGSTDVARRAISSGAYHYVSKPFTSDEVLITIVNALHRRSLEMENRTHRENLEGLVKERTAQVWESNQELMRAEQDVRASHEETIERLSIAAELRDDATGKHIQRMSRYCQALSYELWGDAERAERLRIASMMHDVGKIGIPDHILRKPGSLADDEYETMQQHTTIGYRILSESKSDLLALAAKIALTHHKRFDGSGYPNGFAGDEIPEEGRIAAVADVFDALTTNRVYRKAFSIPEAVRMMQADRGSHFDPQILDVFLDKLDLILKIKEQEER